MRSRTIGVLFLMAFCLSASPILAQEASEREPARMDPVVVTAGRVAEKPTTVTQAMTVIPREEIEKHQYQNMGELLRTKGIQFDSYNPNQIGLSTLVMRGVRSVSDSDLHGGVLVLMDGRRTGTNNISLIPLVNVERIEIIRGLLQDRQLITRILSQVRNSNRPRRRRRRTPRQRSRPNRKRCCQSDNLPARCQADNLGNFHWVIPPMSHQ